MNYYSNYDAPLYDALKRHVESGKTSFHTPGHKGHCEFLRLDTQLDLTELPDTDSLYECDGCIRESEIRAAAMFGTKYTALSSGGCTLAIQGMLAAFAGAGGKVIFSRNIHRSAINTAMLLGIRPVWIMHRHDCGEGLPGRISPDDVKAAIINNPDARAVYITSPDYYGCLSDIQSISGVCGEYGIPLLVDNAHGTHLIVFGLHPITLGAQASACSAHKTLPVLTGGAWLNCNDENAIPRIKSCMSLFGSTSPSYLIMASLDLARAWMEKDGQARFRQLAENVSELREIALRKGFGLPEGECDPVRLTLLPRRLGMSGNDAADYFRNHGLECEHSDSCAVIFILTPFNSPREIEQLKCAIEQFPKGKAVYNDCPDYFPDILPEMEISPGETLLCNSVIIPTEKALGRISAQAACPCPPGVSVVMPGEKINENCVNILLKTGIRHINVIE